MDGEAYMRGYWDAYGYEACEPNLHYDEDAGEDNAILSYCQGYGDRMDQNLTEDNGVCPPERNSRRIIAVLDLNARTYS